MDYQFNETFVSNILRDCSRSIVGRLCKQIELIDVKTGLSEKQKFDILKAFNRELIYESFRDLENQLKAYQEGRTFTKFTIYSPTDSQESV